MRPLQDQCEPTPFEDIEKLFLSDIGKPISELFSEFNAEPVGVASLAQVHLARVKESGQEVAVKACSYLIDVGSFDSIMVFSYNIHISPSSAISTWRWWRCL